MTARRLIIEADGGSRGNPGVAGFGALVRDAGSGAVLAERAEPLGLASNNVAEYSGLIAGLQEAERLDDRAAIEVRMDSKLVVEQMSGRWMIRHEDMKRLAAEARVIAKRIAAAGGVVVYRWIPRELNKAADALSNDGMDGKSITRRPWERGSTPLGVTPQATPDEPQSESPVEPDSQRLEQPADAAAAVWDAAPAARPGQTQAPEPPPSRLPRPKQAKSGPVMGPGTRIVLVRHGTTDANRDGRLAGRSAPGGGSDDLNADGQAQARAAAIGAHAFLGDGCAGDGATPVRVVSSSLLRAHRTGQLVAARFGVGCESESDWDEQDFGGFDGQLVSALSASDPELLSSLRIDPQARCPGGESYADLARRVQEAFDRLVAAGGTIVVTTHRMPILAVLARVLGMDLEHAWRVNIAPASLTSIRVWEDGAALVEFVNDTAHLR
ncbi:MAG: bifunctional RNase H/acid phosphatase [Micrococcales bacterium]|nr:bifunctional RNase H/acid phosphatase [Micrococcales bacterium]